VTLGSHFQIVSDNCAQAHAKAAKANSLMGATQYVGVGMPFAVPMCAALEANVCHFASRLSRTLTQRPWLGISSITSAS
jgi:hypothetical protein